MLVFRTIFPLNPAATLQQLIDISIEWIDNSPEYVMREKLGDLYGRKSLSVPKEMNPLSALGTRRKTTNMRASALKKELMPRNGGPSTFTKKRNRMCTLPVQYILKQLIFKIN